jgi:hypothetical protein
MSGCRDCKICIEAGGMSFILGIPRLIIWIFTFWNIGLMQKKCPTCSHKMSIHIKRADGSLSD